MLLFEMQAQIQHYMTLLSRATTTILLFLGLFQSNTSRERNNNIEYAAK